MTCKTVRMSLSFLVEAVDGTIQTQTDDKFFESVTTDSREVLPGMLFIALRGENFDGNQYVKTALEKGASFALAEKAPEGMEDRVVVVPDSL